MEGLLQDGAPTSRWSAHARYAIYFADMTARERSTCQISFDSAEHHRFMCSNCKFKCTTIQLGFSINLALAPQLATKILLPSQPPPLQARLLSMVYTDDFCLLDHGHKERLRHMPLLDGTPHRFRIYNNLDRIQRILTQSCDFVSQSARLIRDPCSKITRTHHTHGDGILPLHRYTAPCLASLVYCKEHSQRSMSE